MANDIFKGIHGIPNNNYSNMPWDEAMSKIFGKLPNRTTVELETAKAIVVNKCRETDNENAIKLQKIRNFIKDYDGAIIISDTLSTVSGQQLINELKELLE